MKAPLPGKRQYALRLLIFPGIPLLLIFIAYQYFFYPPNFERFLVNQMRARTGADLALDVHRSSLLYGFDITDVRMLRRSDGEPLFEANRVHLSWFLPSVLVGHVGIRELHLKDPVLYLTERDGIWNWSSIFPSREKPEDEPERDIPERIDLPAGLALRVYANLRIENFALKYTSHRTEENGNVKTNHANIENVNLQLGAITRTFDSIPLDVSLLNLFDTFIVALNPHWPINVDTGSDPIIKGKLRSSWFLYHNNIGDRTEFASRLHLDGSGLNLRRAGARNGYAPAYAVYYDMAYDAPADRLLIQSVELRHRNEKWLHLHATVDQVSTPQRSMQLHMDPSRVRLDGIGDLIAGLTGGGERFMSGRVDINELNMNGTVDRLNVQGDIAADQLIFKGGGTHNIRQFRLDLSALLDLYPFLPAVKPPESYEPDQNLAFGLFYNLNAPDLRLIYNNARLDGDIAITPEEGVRANIDVANLNIAQFAPEYIQGLVNGNIRFTSPETFKQLSVAGNVNLRNGRYTIDRSRSGYQSLNLNTRATLFLDRKDVELEINDLTLNGRNAEGAPMLHLNAGGKLAFGDEQVYDTDIHRLQIDYQNLRPSLPGSIRYMLGPYQTYLSRGLGLNGDLTMRVSDSFSILSDNTLSIPFLKVDDLRIVNRLHFEENRIRFEKVDLQAFRGSLTAALQGVLQKRAEEWTPTLNVSMHIERPELYQVHDNLRLQGLASLEADVNGDRARGRVFIQDLDVEYFEGVCSTANPDCYSVYVQDLNLDLPFLHDVAWRDPLQLSQNPGKTYMQDYGQGQQSNFVIGSVHSSHNPRGEFAPGRFYYIGAPANQNVSGLAARLDYKKNVLIADHLRVRMYQPPEGGGPNANRWQAEGAIDSRELYLNLADLDTENMEAGINLAIKNLNLEPFLPRSKSNYDGIISADARLESTNLKEPLYNTTALVSIHRISPEFSGFVTRILMPAQIVALIVRNTLEIPAMRAELKGGLVYSYIKIQRARMFPGILISPGSDEIKQERMPLAQFLDRARSEVRDFAERGPGSDVNETTP